MSYLSRFRLEQARERKRARERERLDTSEALHRCQAYLAAGGYRKHAVRKAAVWLHYECAYGSFRSARLAIEAALDAASPTCRT